MPKTYIENLHNEDGGTVNIHQAPHIIPKVLTKQTGLANDLDFIGRKDELEKVDELLNQNATLLLLNGIGGIGKSTLASYYLNQNKDNFDYYGFVQVNEDIKLSLASAFSTSLDLKSEKIDDLFAEIMNKLQNLEGKKLLIIDDVKEMDNQLDEMNTLMTLKNNGFQILFTSRETKEYIPQYFLDIMTVEDARELFLKHYSTDEMDKVDKILEYLDYHTLFIAITAKTLTKRKRTLSLEKMIAKFANGEFASIKKNKNESFNQFLNDLFSDDKILQDEKTLLFLKRLSVLPSIEISFENLYKFLVCEDEDRLELFLNELVGNGWLIESDSGYKFHQILKEFIFDNYLVEFEEIEGQIIFFMKFLEESTKSLSIIDGKQYIIFFEYIDILLTQIKIDTKAIANFSHYLGNFYMALGVYEKAEKAYLKALTIQLSILDDKHTDIAISYLRLGRLYCLFKINNKAKFFCLQALSIHEKIYDEGDSKIAHTYQLLAEIYWLEKNYVKAESFYLKALKIQEDFLEDESRDKLSTYNGLAGLYETTKEYKKAEFFYSKSLLISRKILGEEHATTATLYNNIAGFYELIGAYNEARFCYFTALSIRLKILGYEHPDTANSYNNIAIFYYHQGDFTSAFYSMLKSLNIRKSILNKNHPDLIGSKKDLEIIKRKLK